MSLQVQEIRVMVDVDNLQPIRSFYTELLGIEERQINGDSDGIAMFELGPGRVIEFFEESQKHRSPVELSLEISDVRSLWERVQIKALVVFPLRHNEWGDTSFCIQDPAGCTLIFFTRDTTN